MPCPTTASSARPCSCAWPPASRMPASTATFRRACVDSPGWPECQPLVQDLVNEPRGKILGDPLDSRPRQPRPGAVLCRAGLARPERTGKLLAVAADQAGRPAAPGPAQQPTG